MGLVESIAEWQGRRKVARMRQGKEGPEMKGVIEFLDGKKRYLVLILFLVQAVADASGHPVGGGVKAVMAVLGLSEGDAVVNVAYVTQLGAAGYAIWDGIRKDREKRARIVR